jgi:membrane protease YdiL (CAAX protease family)
MYVWLTWRGIALSEIVRFSTEHLTMSDIIVRCWLACTYGAALGAAALGYLYVLHHWFDVIQNVRDTADRIDALGDSSGWTLFLAVALAPLAAEYPFRGLLYRALDREWGGVRAILGQRMLLRLLYHGPVS